MQYVADLLAIYAAGGATTSPVVK